MCLNRLTYNLKQVHSLSSNSILSILFHSIHSAILLSCLPLLFPFLPLFIFLPPSLFSLKRLRKKLAALALVSSNSALRKIRKVFWAYIHKTAFTGELLRKPMLKCLCLNNQQVLWVAHVQFCRGFRIVTLPGTWRRWDVGPTPCRSLLCTIRWDLMPVYLSLTKHKCQSFCAITLKRPNLYLTTRSTHHTSRPSSWFSLETKRY